MHLIYNGKPIEIPDRCPLIELLNIHGIDANTFGIAIAINRRIIRKSSWHEIHLASEDEVDIIHAVQGG
jgi:sulfur carrier protein